MTLKEWMSAKEVTLADFATRIGRTSESVRRYANGDRIPDKETMPLIALATAGAVTANDFFGIETAPQANAA